jgi:hypothetical protein
LAELTSIEFEVFMPSPSGPDAFAALAEAGMASMAITAPAASVVRSFDMMNPPAIQVTITQATTQEALSRFPGASKSAAVAMI